MDYKTIGTLNKNKDNAILVCHSLTNDINCNVWWSNIIGTGKSIDPDKYFIICIDAYNPSITSLNNIIKEHKKIIDSLSINKLLAVIGASFGGMQALEWAVTYPELMINTFVIASTGKHTPRQIMFNEVQRQAIKLDPINGLGIARMIAHITYLSDDSLFNKFGHDTKIMGDYLTHQADKFINHFDSDRYIALTKISDSFDVLNRLNKVKSNISIISISSDWLYEPKESLKIVDILYSNDIPVNYKVFNSNYGHDSFLIDSKFNDCILFK
jgi:homoserine O-acetyltransferase